MSCVGRLCKDYLYLHRRSWGGDRNECLAGQIWELGRTEKKILAVDNLENTTFCQFSYHFYLFSAIFGCFLPHIPVFPPFLPFFQPFIWHFCQFAEQFGRVAWHSSLAEQNCRKQIKMI